MPGVFARGLLTPLTRRLPWRAAPSTGSSRRPRGPSRRSTRSGRRRLVGRVCAADVADAVVPTPRPQLHHPVTPSRAILGCALRCAATATDVCSERAPRWRAPWTRGTRERRGRHGHQRAAPVHGRTRGERPPSQGRERAVHPRRRRAGSDPVRRRSPPRTPRPSPTRCSPSTSGRSSLTRVRPTSATRSPASAGSASTSSGSARWSGSRSAGCGRRCRRSRSSGCRT